MVGGLLIPPWLRALGFSPYLLLSRGDGLVWGALLALLVEDRERLARRVGWFRGAFAATAIGALVGPPLLGLFVEGVPTLGPFQKGANVGDPLFTTRVCLIDFGLAGLIVCSPGHRAFRLLRDRRLVYLGVVSYGLYLYHPLVYATFPGLYRQFVIQGLGIRSRRLMDAATLAVVFGLAEVSRRGLENRLQACKAWLSYRERVRGDAGSIASTSSSIAGASVHPAGLGQPRVSAWHRAHGLDGSRRLWNRTRARVDPPQ